jgi:hypothetical protein
MLEAALTWTPESSGVEQSARRIARTGQDPELVKRLSSRLTSDAASTLIITYPQYGGLTLEPAAASVMVVARQVLQREPGAAPREEGFTCDVRLRKVGRTWKVEDLILGAAPIPAQTNESVKALLANEQVVLPEAARLDLRSGVVDERLIALLSTLAQNWRLDVQVLRSGHPLNVFGTKRPSNHTAGRAVDIWALDGKPVVDHARAPWKAVMKAAARAGAQEIGGPAIPETGRGRTYFTDAVHQDHLHLAFRSAPKK